MLRRRFLARVSLLALLLPSLSVPAYACEPAEEPLLADSAEAFAALEAARAPIDLEAVDYALLAQAVFFETNLRRKEHGRQGLAYLTDLDRAACHHAEAMVEEGFFAHRNPNDPSRATPLDRVQNQGLRVGFVAENIGQMFALRYEPGSPVYVRQANGETIFSRQPGGEPVAPHSYLSFADALLDAWMNSPPHRKNVLAEQPGYLGAGCQLTQDDELGMPMFACVQLFFAPLEAR